MAEPEYDDTDMTPEEFEREISGALPAAISFARPGTESQSGVSYVVVVKSSPNTAGGWNPDIRAVKVRGQVAQIVRERHEAEVG